MQNHVIQVFAIVYIAAVFMDFRHATVDIGTFAWAFLFAGTVTVLYYWSPLPNNNYREDAGGYWGFKRGDA